MLPIVARKAHHPQHARKDLWLLLIVSGILGSGIVGLYAMMSDTLVRLVFTDKFIAAVPLVFWMGLAIFWLCASQYLRRDFIVIKIRRKAAWISLLGFCLPKQPESTLFHARFDSGCIIFGNRFLVYLP